MRGIIAGLMAYTALISAADAMNLDEVLTRLNEAERVEKHYISSEGMQIISTATKEEQESGENPHFKSFAATCPEALEKLNSPNLLLAVGNRGTRMGDNWGDLLQKNHLIYDPTTCEAMLETVVDSELIRVYSNNEISFMDERVITQHQSWSKPWGEYYGIAVDGQQYLIAEGTERREFYRVERAYTPGVDELKEGEEVRYWLAEELVVSPVKGEELVDLLILQKRVADRMDQLSAKID